MSPATVTNQMRSWRGRPSFLYFEHVLLPAFRPSGRKRRARRQSFGAPSAAQPPCGDSVKTKQMALFISMNMSNENNQANRTISTGKLHALLHFHTRPINVVVFHGSQGNTRFQVGFPLRCLQRLSIPYIATLLCGWRHNRSTRDMSIPVLSY